MVTGPPGSRRATYKVRLSCPEINKDFGTAVISYGTSGEPGEYISVQSPLGGGYFLFKDIEFRKAMKRGTLKLEVLETENRVERVLLTNDFNIEVSTVAVFR